MKGLNDHKLVTFPSAVIKPFDNFVLTHPNLFIEPLLDPLYFTSYTDQQRQAQEYMEKSCLVVDFSSVFSTLIHELLQTKLYQLTNPTSTCQGISSILIGGRE